MQIFLALLSYNAPESFTMVLVSSARSLILSLFKNKTTLFAAFLAPSAKSVRCLVEKYMLWPYAWENFDSSIPDKKVSFYTLPPLPPLLISICMQSAKNRGGESQSIPSPSQIFEMGDRRKVFTIYIESHAERSSKKLGPDIVSTRVNNPSKVFSEATVKRTTQQSTEQINVPALVGNGQRPTGRRTLLLQG